MDQVQFKKIFMVSVIKVTLSENIVKKKESVQRTTRLQEWVQIKAQTIFANLNASVRLR